MAKSTLYPRGQLNADDEGALASGIATDYDRQVVVIQYAEPLYWLALDIKDLFNFEGHKPSLIKQSLLGLLIRHHQNLTQTRITLWVGKEFTPDKKVMMPTGITRRIQGGLPSGDTFDYRVIARVDRTHYVVAMDFSREVDQLLLSANQTYELVNAIAEVSSHLLAYQLNLSIS